MIPQEPICEQCELTHDDDVSFGLCYDCEWELEIEFFPQAKFLLWAPPLLTAEEVAFGLSLKD